MKKILFTFYCFLLFTDFSSAATNYVWISSPVPASPYTSWATASHSIQDAVSAAAVGNVVLVTNGVYTGNGYSDDRIGECVVANRKNIILKSVNGWDGTVIDGQNTRRCIFSTNGVIVGFTLRNGLGGTPAWYYFSYRRFSFGGGALVKETCVMSNCFVFNCSGYNYGGGIYINGRGIITNSIIYYNFPENIYNSSQGQFGYCCATPLVSGAGNISDAPGFTNGYKLAIGSSCINAGLDEGWMTGAKDLAGNSRIIGGQVDMGCYETVPEPCVFGAVISYLLLVIGIWRKK